MQRLHGFCLISFSETKNNNVFGSGTTGFVSRSYYGALWSNRVLLLLVAFMVVAQTLLVI